MTAYKKLLRGYIELLKFPLTPSNNTKYFLNFDLKLYKIIIILGIIGIIRNILEVLIGGKWANQWFAFSPDIFFTMFFYPIFLCFFSTILLHFITKKLNINLNIKKILSLTFSLQILHLFIPFFDGIADFYNIPYNINITDLTYLKLIFTPVAFTPIILFFTHPTSLGIDIAWIFTLFILLKLFIKIFKFSIIKSIIILSFSFYIIYLAIYPIYYFYLNEYIIGTNYMFGIYFLSLSVPSIMYIDIIKK